MITRTFEALVRRTQGVAVNFPVTVTLEYDAGTNPFAVEVVFQPPGEPDVVWSISRDLLVGGLDSSTVYGQGDIRFRYSPEADAVLMCLKSHEGHADIALPHEEVAGFLEDTEDAAEISDEACGALVDAFIKEVLES